VVKLKMAMNRAAPHFGSRSLSEGKEGIMLVQTDEMRPRAWHFLILNEEEGR
jgi:hypothetical protein